MKRNLKSINRMPLIVGLFVLSAALIFSVSCNTTTQSTAPESTPAPSETSDTVDISNFSFVAETVTVSVGTKVTWTNQDSVAHTVTSDDDLFDSGRLSNGASVSYTFTEAGTYSYFCSIHPYMTAKIIVQ